MILKKILCQALCKSEIKRIDDLEEYGFETYDDFCKIQNEIIDNSTDNEIMFYVQLYDNLVGNAGMVDKEDMGIWNLDGFFFIYDTNEKPRIVFYHER